MISTVILTRNEEKDLPDCLQSLSWCDDVHVLDSGSTDKTNELAVNAGAIVSVHPFESFGKQRNYALDNLKLKYDWILFLDADERVTPKFLEEIRRSVSEAGPSTAGFYCCWKMMLDGVWLKHCDNFPKWQFRLMKKGMARFTDFGHGQKEDQVQGDILYIREPYLHFGFSKGWHAWVDRHNRYSGQEAVERLNNRPPFKNMFDRHGSVRNPAIKSWMSHVPGWPLLRFIQAYIFNLGFLEGRPGFIYCVNMAYYEFLILIKMHELRRAQSENKKT